VSMRSVTSPKTEEEQRKFTELLQAVMIRHKHIVPTMAQGIYEVKRALGTHNSYLIDECMFLQDFLERFYLGRLGIRVILGKFVLHCFPSLP
jgi:pyruvate dehydrogenase kinase 2/3/4